MEETGSLRGVCRGGWKSRWAICPGERCSLPGAAGGGLGLPGVSSRPVLRVVSSLWGHRGQRGDRGDLGQGPALGLLAARGISQGPQTPRVRSALIEVRLGETGFRGDSPCWVQAIWARQSAGREALVRRCPPRGFLMGCGPGASRSRGVGGRLPIMSQHPPPTLHLNTRRLLSLK